jgi:hypothetical protein
MPCCAPPPPRTTGWRAPAAMAPPPLPRVPMPKHRRQPHDSCSSSRRRRRTRRSSSARSGGGTRDWGSVRVRAASRRFTATPRGARASAPSRRRRRRTRRRNGPSATMRGVSRGGSAVRWDPSSTLATLPAAAARPPMAWSASPSQCTAI